MRSWHFSIILAALAVLSAAVPSLAQATKPTGPFENQAIRVATPGGTPASRPAAAKSADTPFLDAKRVILSLAVVVALIFGVSWTLKRFFPAAAGGRGSGAVRVLSRSPVTPRQHVLLVQVGRRVLVVADNGTQMSALSEIREPDEVAHLIGQLSTSGRRDEFDAAIGAAERDYTPTGVPSEEADAPPASSEPSLASTQGEIQGLLSKVRELTRQFGR